jgi:hypothetical protein
MQWVISLVTLEMAEVRFKNEKGIIHIDWGGALAVVWWQEECG